LLKPPWQGLVDENAHVLRLSLQQSETEIGAFALGNGEL